LISKTDEKVLNRMELEIALTLPDDLTVEAVHDWLQNQPHVRYVRTTALTNIYFDTETQDLKKQKAALRLRFDDDKNQWLQTLKTAGKTDDGISIRHEWENPLTDANINLTAFEPVAQNYLTAYINKITPVFETNFERRIYHYEHNGEIHEYAIDHGAVWLTNQERNVGIYELEIELKQGSAEHLRLLASQAQIQLNANPQTKSKAARGYELLDEAHNSSNLD
jgi:triphosphatase